MRLLEAKREMLDMVEVLQQAGEVGRLLNSLSYNLASSFLAAASLIVPCRYLFFKEVYCTSWRGKHENLSRT